MFVVLTCTSVERTRPLICGVSSRDGLSRLDVRFDIGDRGIYSLAVTLKQPRAPQAWGPDLRKMGASISKLTLPENSSSGGSFWDFGLYRGNAVTRRLRGACIGYGFISEGGHSPSYRLRSDNPGHFEIVAVADITPARRAAAARAYPMARLYDSWERLLDKEARNLDFVDITTPPYAHAEIAHAALDCRLMFCAKSHWRHQ